MLRDKGQIASTRRSSLDAHQLADWMEDLCHLTFTLVFDGDITIAHILLQEEGFRLYANYAIMTNVCWHSCRKCRIKNLSVRIITVWVRTTIWIPISLKPSKSILNSVLESDE